MKVTRSHPVEGCPLSRQQFRSLALVACGYTREEVCEVLGLALSTVRTHLHVARVKLRAETVEQAIVEVAVRWLQTPRRGVQHYLDEFDQRLGVVTARADRGRRQPYYPDLDDLVQGVTGKAA